MRHSTVPVGMDESSTGHDKQDAHAHQMQLPTFLHVQNLLRHVQVSGEEDATIRRLGNLFASAELLMTVDT